MAEVENIDKAVDEQYNGSLPPYIRQVFVCYHKPWLPGVELEQGFPQRFARSFEDRKADLAVETELNVCDGGESDGDVLIFPDMMRYKALKDTEVDAFVEDVVVNGKTWTSGVQEELRGSFVFVSAQDRDAHAFLDKFEQEIGSRGLSDQIFVKLCSPLGGHKFPGNLIVYSPDSALEVSGDWSLTPEDVPALLDQLIAKRDQVIQNLEAEIVPSGKGLVEQEPVEKPAGVCCQGEKGVSCCQEDRTPVKKEEGSMKNPEPDRKEEGFKKLNWFMSMEKEELLLGAAAVGSIVTIAVAYIVYKRSG